ncbi:MAG: hypothetical protein WCO05_05000 [Candidatus Moraniibacteriota bacterium]|jgi:hypothetical protein
MSRTPTGCHYHRKKKDVETLREIWVCDDAGAEYVREDLAFPGVKQVAKIRKTISRKGKIITIEDWYGLTSCSRATLPPLAFLKTVRGHWSVENSLHHVKDRSWLEDKIYSKNTEPGLTLGILRNLSLNLIRGFGVMGKKIKSMPKIALDLLLDPSETLRLLAKA